MKAMSCWIILELLKRHEKGIVSMEEIKRILENAPETDLEQVTRCRGCIYARKSAEGMGIWCKIHAEQNRENDYCSDAIPNWCYTRIERQATKKKE